MIRHYFSRRGFLRTTGSGLIALTLATRGLAAKDTARKKPNILFCLSDDQSWPHASGMRGAVSMVRAIRPG